MAGFSVALFLGVAAAWVVAAGARRLARSYLRLAAVLYAALAASEGFAFWPEAVMAMVLSAGAASLAMASYGGFRRAPRIFSAAMGLAGSGLAGLTAFLVGLPVLAAVPQVTSAALIAVFAWWPLWQGRRSGVYLMLCGLALIGAAACSLAPGPLAKNGLLLFAAAAVLGAALASNLFVEEEGKRRTGLPVDHR
ncbi:hypothetical protein FHS83_001983 [Rhizomicrobium palustre]|jgi:hypothetical protein|uniref:Uncharacterized protein n=1 Tax=Rhizomicrobium palustre TaxID=189966 RepID=A0A846MZK2_9PROT|nr:hypothetical protein [Rhizomicrobium palustre]NIK88665.1 hypothetical protein [Rhizomicrobium palustre]